MLSEALRSAGAGLSNKLSIIPQAKEAITDFKKQSKFGTEKVKDFAIGGAASALGNVLPALSTILTSILASRNDAQNKVEDVFAAAKEDPQLKQLLDEKLKDSKNPYKDLFKVFREFQKKEGNEDFEQSELFTKFNDIVNYEKPKKEISEDKKENQYDSEVKDLLSNIESNTDLLNKKFDTFAVISPKQKDKAVVPSRLLQKMIENNAKAEKNNPKLQALEKEKERMMVEVRESNETQTLLREINNNIRQGAVAAANTQSANSGDLNIGGIIGGKDKDGKKKGGLFERGRGFFSKFKPKGLSIGGLAAGVATAGLLSSGAIQEGSNVEKGLAIAGTAATGATIGSFLGPVGTVIGGLLGAGYGTYQALANSDSPEVVKTGEELTSKAQELSASNVKVEADGSISKDTTTSDIAKAVATMDSVIAISEKKIVGNPNASASDIETLKTLKVTRDKFEAELKVRQSVGKPEPKTRQRGIIPGVDIPTPITQKVVDVIKTETNKTEMMAAKNAKEAASQPIIVNTPITNNSVSGGQGIIVPPVVRNNESTHQRLQERDFWGRTQ